MSVIIFGGRWHQISKPPGVENPCVCVHTFYNTLSGIHTRLNGVVVRL